MKFLRVVGCGFLLGLGALQAEAQQPPPGVLTLHESSRLVFMDVTVLDKKNHVVVKGLTKDDFTITDEKKPQRIFSFEAPEVHLVKRAADADNVASTVLVLDLLNSEFEDAAYLRYSMQKYLESQPKELNSATEMMVLGNTSLEVLEGYTRSRADLLDALKHLPAAIPYKMMSASFFAERFVQSLDALQQIALQNKGVPGRKNIVWLGHGGPNLNTYSLPSGGSDELNRYVHDTTNMLVDARMSLFVIYPGLPARGPAFNLTATYAAEVIGDEDPFAGDINFAILVNATGGKLYYARNDVATEIKESEELGSNYYTLTYQPQEGNQDGRFRRIRVTLRDPNLHVVTKVGYYAPDKNAPKDTRQMTLQSISEAARATVPFHALDVSIDHIVRHPDTGTVSLAVVLQPRDLIWQPDVDGKSFTRYLVLSVSLDDQRKILAAKIAPLTSKTDTQDAAKLALRKSQIPVTLRLPKRTRNVRVVIAASDSGRIGSVEISRKAIDAAPEAPTPDPQLLSHP